MLTAFRFGRRVIRIVLPAGSGSRPRTVGSQIRVSSQGYAWGRRTQMPMLASPPLSPERAPAMVPSGRRRVSAAPVDGGGWGRPAVDDGGWGPPAVDHGGWGPPAVDDGGGWGPPAVDDGRRLSGW